MPATQLPGTRPLHRAVFIDKDGTLVENVPYNVDPALLRFTPHAVHALQRWAEQGYLLIVVSNQPGIAMGRFDLAALANLATALTDRLAAHGVALAAFYACPHAAGAGCDCRKPAPGLLLKAARDQHIDLAQSWMVGDILDDVEAGRRAGCGTVLLDVGNETEWLWSPLRQPDFRAGHLAAAADATLAQPIVWPARHHLAPPADWGPVTIAAAAGSAA